jgi:hypothetical protein
MGQFDSPFAAVLYSTLVDHPDHPDIRALYFRRQLPETMPGILSLE